MTNDYLRAELEQLRMVYSRLCDNVDRFDLELTRLEVAAGAHPGKCPHKSTVTESKPGCPVTVRCLDCGQVDEYAVNVHPGESWQTEDIPPFHWHGDEKCNCEISFTDPADVKRDEWEGIP